MNTATECLLRMVEEHHDLEDYQGGVPRWCTGCGDNAILTAVQRLCRDENLRPEKTAFVSGIGCSSRFPHYMKTYGFHGIHGRARGIERAGGHADGIDAQFRAVRRGDDLRRGRGRVGAVEPRIIFPVRTVDFGLSAKHVRCPAHVPARGRGGAQYATGIGDMPMGRPFAKLLIDHQADAAGHVDADGGEVCEPGGAACAGACEADCTCTLPTTTTTGPAGMPGSSSSRMVPSAASR